jgi:hypothetical protein
MTAAQLKAEMENRACRGVLFGQPPDGTVFIRTRGGHVMRRSIEAAAALIRAGASIADYSQIPRPFGRLNPWEESNAR